MDGLDRGPATAVYAVKIYWPKEGSCCEGSILREIHKLLENRVEQKYFLNVVEDGYSMLQVSPGVYTEDTTRSILREELVSKDFYPGSTGINQSRKGKNPIEGSAREESTGGLEPSYQTMSATGISGDNYSDPDVKKFLTLRWVNRIQYRIVFDWVGKTIAQSESLLVFFTAIRHAFLGKLYYQLLLEKIIDFIQPLKSYMN